MLMGYSKCETLRYITVGRMRLRAIFDAGVIQILRAIGSALATVQAFAVASIVIYSSLMVIVLIASRRWYAAQQNAQHSEESFD